ncbi:MAG: AI-2E family transporter [Firmicutes bacterium]|nr:AI-2E family transporter [Bacillota bacterium]
MTARRRRMWLDSLIVLATILAAMALGAAVVAAARLVAHTLLVLVLAGVLAVLLNPLVARLQEQRASRALAVALVVVATLLLVAGLALALVRPLITQVGELSQALPGYVAAAREAAPVWQERLAQMGLRLDVDKVWPQVTSRLESVGLQVLSRLGDIVGQIGGAAADIVLVAVLTIYLMLDGPRLARGLRAWVPAPHRARYDEIARITSRLLGAYVRGQITLAFILGILAGVGTWLLGVPYAALIGLLAGLFELVPMVGPVLGAIPAVLLALLVSWRTALYVVIYFILIQQLEGHVLVPRVTGHAVGLRPSVAIVTLLGGFELAGLWGALFAVPAVGILSAVVGALWGPGAGDGSGPAPGAPEGGAGTAAAAGGPAPAGAAPGDERCGAAPTVGGTPS